MLIGGKFFTKIIYCTIQNVNIANFMYLRENSWIRINDDVME